jgi:uncharacterized membrane protein
LGEKERKVRRESNPYFLTLGFVLAVTGKASAEGPNFTAIDVPGAISTNAFDINHAGDIVGDYVSADGHTHGYLLSGNRFTQIDFPGAILTSAFGINRRGDIVGRYQTDGVFHGYLLRGGTFTSIDFSATFTRAQGINGSGDIVGSYDDADQTRHGFLLSEEEFTSFDFPDATLTTAWGINPAGGVTGRYVSSDGKSHGFLISEGEFTSIDFPGAVETAPGGVPTAPIVRINPRGDIVGSYCESEPCSLPEPMHGFLLSRDEKRNGGEFTSIDLPGAIWTAAAGINARGDIVGTYIDQGGKTHGFLLSRGERDETADDGDADAES